MANQLTGRNHGNSATGRPPLVFPDRNNSRRCNLELLQRSARVALALLLIFTIAYILITPDPTDDVDGVLGPNHPELSQRTLAASLWEFHSQMPVQFRSFTLPDRSRHLAEFELLDIISVCRC
jgi:hypothetical protein